MPWDVLLFLSVILVLVEQVLKNSFNDSFYRYGVRVLHKVRKGDWDPRKVELKITKTTRECAYYFTDEGETCFFRLKYKKIVTFIPTSYFRGVARRRNGKVEVSLYLSMGELLVILCLEAWTGHYLLGLIAAVLSYFGINGYFGAFDPRAKVEGFFDQVLQAVAAETGQGKDV